MGGGWPLFSVVWHGRIKEDVYGMASKPTCSLVPGCSVRNGVVVGSGANAQLLAIDPALPSPGEQSKAFQNRWTER